MKVFSCPIAPSREVGDAEIVKVVGGGVEPPGAMVVRLAVVVFVFPPPVAVTVMVLVAAGVDDVVVIVRVEVPVGVTEVGLKFGVAPEGKPDALKLTEELNPPWEVSVIV